MTITALKLVTGYYLNVGVPSIESAVTTQIGAGWTPLGAPQLTDTYGQCAQTMVQTSQPGATAYTIAVSTIPTPPDATWDPLSQAVWVDTVTWLQAYTKGFQYLAPASLTSQVAGILPVLNGGTGSSTAAGARTNLGIGTIGTLNTVNLTTNVTGILPVVNGGTGANDAATARANLGVGTIGTLNTVSLVTNVVGILPVANGGTNASDAAGARTSLGVAYGTTAGTVTQGNDTRLSTINGNSGGTLTSAVVVPATAGNLPSVTVAAGTGGVGENLGNKFDSAVITGTTPPNDAYVQVIGGSWLNAGYWQAGGVRNGGQMSAFQITVKGDNATAAVLWKFNNTGIATGTFQNPSDIRIKGNRELILDPLDKMQQFRGYEWDRLDNNLHGYGFIAQDVQSVFPKSVSAFGSTTLKDGSVVQDTLSLDTAGVAAALHHEAILALMAKIELLEAKVEALESVN